MLLHGVFLFALDLEWQTMKHLFSTIQRDNAQDTTVLPTNRRQFLVGSVALGALALTSSAVIAEQYTNTDTFAYGVASGDPTQTSLVIWTQAQGQEKVEWQVATDQEFRQIVKQSLASTGPNRDFTVKVDVKGLRPGTQYYYRFKVNGKYSPVGKSKTLPEGKVEALNIAVASCSNYVFGFFNAYAHIAQDSSIDFVLHLGDYIYEYGHDGWGADSGKILNREHQPGNEIITLQDYRTRHRQYKSDHGSQLMHAAHPLISIWDDHESANNPYVDGAQNHQPETEGDWSTRRAASIQAYYEWMPIRDPEEGQDPKRLWRKFVFGDLATLVTLETRHTARAKQFDYFDVFKTAPNQEQRDHFMKQSLADPSRKMLHPDMENFLAQALQESCEHKQPWRVIGNQIPIARTHAPNLASIFEQRRVNTKGYALQQMEHLQMLGELDLPLYLDTWDGYEGAREQFYQTCAAVNATDLLVLTGDSHSFWANQLYSANGQSMGVEIGTAGITSPGDFETMGNEMAEIYDRALAEHNAEVNWTDCRHRGYVKVTLTPTEGRVQYVAMRSIISEDIVATVLREETLLPRDGKLTYKA